MLLWTIMLFKNHMLYMLKEIVCWSTASGCMVGSKWDSASLSFDVLYVQQCKPSTVTDEFDRVVKSGLLWPTAYLDFKG